MIEDAELLRRYVEEKSEAAFSELVQRHLGVVFHSALRQVGGDVHSAQDVAQAVFSGLARKAPALLGHSLLVGWLFTSTRHAAAQVRRTERRRFMREQEAFAMQELLRESEVIVDWERMRPFVDDALHALRPPEREAVLLRFFQGRPFAEVASRLAVTEDAARMRVERALGKLRTLLARRGVTSSAAALALALSSQASFAVPAGLAGSITGAALASATAAGGTGVASLLTFFMLNKIPLALTGTLTAAALSGFAFQHQTNATLQSELAAIHADKGQMTALRSENSQLVAKAAEAEALRRDDAELAEAHAEAAHLRAEFEEASRKEAAATSSRLASAAQPKKVDLRLLDQAPAVRSQAAPTYPVELRRAGLEGEVSVSFVVDSAGGVRDVKAVESALKPTRALDGTDAIIPSGLTDAQAREAFEQAAIAAVEQWKFRPGVKGQRPVNTRMTLPIVFSLEKGEGTPGGTRVLDDSAPATWF